MQKNTAQQLLKKVQQDYNTIAKEFDQTRQHAWKEFEHFKPFIKSGQKIADIGCGNGRLYAHLKNNNKIEYIGIDNSEELLKQAKKQNPEANFQYGDLTNIPIKDNSIDTVTAIASFHHLPTIDLRKKSLSEFSRILKEKGTLIISVWNLFQPKYKKYIWQARFKSIISLGKYSNRDTFIPWSKSGIMRYYYAFTPKELKQLIENNGFQVLQTEIGNNILYICQKKSKY